MMANESREGPVYRRLSNEAVSDLRAALLQHWGNPASEDQLRKALDRVAAEAREKEMRAEELIIAFKELWDELPHAQGIGRADEARLRERLITMSIKAYYTTSD
jgi:ethanolamine ammonia-lyase large subunit